MVHLPLEATRSSRFNRCFRVVRNRGEWGLSTNTNSFIWSTNVLRIQFDDVVLYLFHHTNSGLSTFYFIRASFSRRRLFNMQCDKFPDKSEIIANGYFNVLALGGCHDSTKWNEAHLWIVDLGYYTCTPGAKRIYSSYPGVRCPNVVNARLFLLYLLTCPFNWRLYAVVFSCFTPRNTHNIAKNVLIH